MKEFGTGKRQKPEEIIGKLREAAIVLTQDVTRRTYDVRPTGPSR